MEVLDHGYVRLVEAWGSDERIIESARMSTQRGFEGWDPTCAECGWAKGDDHEVGCSRPDRWKPGDGKLLKYLWDHQHHTPFEMAGATFEVQAPIFVFREWHRHRVPFGYNEASARYAPLPDLNYVPTVERLMMGGGYLTKQAAAKEGATKLDPEVAKAFIAGVERSYALAQQVYEAYLESGVPKELARVVLPVGRYSRMRATGNLRGWLGFLKLRMDPAAQWEIVQYAKAVHDHLAGAFPRTMALFDVG